MKSIVGIMILFLISGTQLVGQGFQFGAQVGLVGTKTNQYLKPEVVDFKYTGSLKASYAINGIIGYRSESFWGITLEPGFIQKGESKKNDTDYKRSNYNYIHMPVLAELHFLRRFYIATGPEFAYLISAKAVNEGDSDNFTENFDNRYEISGIVGFGCSVTDNIDIGIRYNHGLTPTQKVALTDSDGIKQADLFIYNQYYQVSLRFKL